MQKQIEQLYNPLFLYIKKRVNDQLDAEDLTQEVFYKLSNSKNSEIKNIKSWMYTIAKNSIIDYYRKHKNIHEDIENLAFFADDIKIFKKNDRHTSTETMRT